MFDSFYDIFDRFFVFVVTILLKTSVSGINVCKILPWQLKTAQLRFLWSLDLQSPVNTYFPRTNAIDLF